MWVMISYTELDEEWGQVNAAFGGLTGATYGSSAVGQTRTYDNRLRVTSESDLGNSPAIPTSGSATVTIIGAEQVQ